MAPQMSKAAAAAAAVAGTAFVALPSQGRLLRAKKQEKGKEQTDGKVKQYILCQLQSTSVPPHTSYQEGPPNITLPSRSTQLRPKFLAAGISCPSSRLVQCSTHCGSAGRHCCGRSSIEEEGHQGRHIPSSFRK